MFSLISCCLLIFFLEGSNGNAIKNTNTGLGGKQNNIPSVSSRFFDLGGILGQLFPGFNQGIQGGSGRNPGGIGFPSNSQFYPGGGGGGGATQASKPASPGQGQGQGGGTWPVIDDASQYPYRGQNPGNLFGTGTPVQNPNYNNPSKVDGGYPQTQYPGQFIFGHLPQGQGPQQGVNQWNPGNVGHNPQQNVYPWNPGNTGQNPQLNVFPWNPGNQGGQDPQQNVFPGISGNPGNIGSPEQGDIWNKNPGQSFGPGTGQDGDGTLDALVPPQSGNPEGYPQQEPGTLENSNNNGQSDQDQEASGSKNAILGRPVVVPTDKTPEESISFPKSTENPLQKQCVQDCRTSTEYSPVCGTDNVTYFNTGRFICARNCGINVFVSRQGRCDQN